MSVAAHIMRWWFIYLIGACVVGWVVINYLSEVRSSGRHRRNLQSIEDEHAEKTRRAEEENQRTSAGHLAR